MSRKPTHKAEGDKLAERRPRLVKQRKRFDLVGQAFFEFVGKRPHREDELPAKEEKEEPMK